MGIAAKTAFNKIKRPPHDNRRARQPPKRISTFSNTGCQSWIRRQRSTSGTPRYRIEKTPIGVASIREQPLISSSDKPNLTNVDLARFSRRPEKSEKMSIMIDSVCAAVMDPWMKNVVSLTYCSKGMLSKRLADRNLVNARAHLQCAYCQGVYSQDEQ